MVCYLMNEPVWGSNANGRRCAFTRVSQPQSAQIFIHEDCPAHGIAVLLLHTFGQLTPVITNNRQG